MSNMANRLLNKRMCLRDGNVIIFCMCLIMGVNVGLVMSSAGIFYHPVSTDLGVPVGKLGIYMSFNFLSSTLMLSIAGRLMDRYSARMLLTICSAVLGLTVVAMGFFNAVWQFYIAGCIIGVTLAFLLYLAFPTMINRWFKSRVGLYMGICSAASGIGGILFNPVGAYLITRYGWRTTYVIFGGIIFLLVTPLLGVLLRDYPEDKGLQPYGLEKQQQAAVTNSGIEYSSAIKMPVFYGLIVFAFLMISVSTLNLFIPKYVTSLDYTLEQASFAASAVMAGVTIGKVVLGMINDRNSLLGVVTTVAGGIAGLVLLLTGQVGSWAVTAGGFLFGWAYAGVTVETPMLVRAVFGSKDYAKIYSNVSIALAAGGAITAGGWGVLADLTTFRFILLLGIVFLTFAGSIGAVALKVRRVETGA